MYLCLFFREYFMFTLFQIQCFLKTMNLLLYLLKANISIFLFLSEFRGVWSLVISSTLRISFAFFQYMIFYICHEHMQIPLSAIIFSTGLFHYVEIGLHGIFGIISLFSRPSRFVFLIFLKKVNSKCTYLWFRNKLSTRCLESYGTRTVPLIISQIYCLYIP